MTQGKDRQDSPPNGPRWDEQSSKRPGKLTGPQSARGRRKPEVAFDQWLNRGLHQLFDNVAKEPIPEDLLKLIENDEQNNSS